MKRAYHQIVESIRQNQVGETDITLVKFGGRIRVEVVFEDRATFQVPPLEYTPANRTPLYDAIGRGIRCLSKHEPAGQKREDEAYLVMVFTDGYENSSIGESRETIRQVIQRKQQQGNWTFTIQVPPGHAYWFSRSSGIPADNIREWEGTVDGVRQLGQSSATASANYFNARARGTTEVSNFYTDLSALDAKTVQTKLFDRQHEFKGWVVDKESDIKFFVEQKTNRPYVAGTGFYQLTKTEKVQPDKEVLIREKFKKPLYRGVEARGLIGLPTDGITHARVKPGNHGNYDIFVQSKSTNRKLVRGTEVYVLR